MAKLWAIFLSVFSFSYSCDIWLLSSCNNFRSDTHPFHISHFKQLKCKSAAQTITLRTFLCKNLISIQPMYQNNCKLLSTTLMTTGFRDAPEVATCSDALSSWTVQYHLASPRPDKPLLTSPEFAQVQILSSSPGLMKCHSGKHSTKIRIFSYHLQPNASNMVIIPVIHF